LVIAELDKCRSDLVAQQQEYNDLLCIERGKTKSLESQLKALKESAAKEHVEFQRKLESIRNAIGQHLFVEHRVEYSYDLPKEDCSNDVAFLWNLRRTI